MNQTSNAEAMQIFTRLFRAEMQFMKSNKEDLRGIAEIFHPDAVVHEPGSLPYAGDWCGHQSLGQLFKSMHHTWSSMNIDNMQATIDGDTLFMCCILVLVARNSGREIRQPFAEVLKIKDGLIIEGTPYYYDTSALCTAISYVSR